MKARWSVFILITLFLYFYYNDLSISFRAPANTKEEKDELNAYVNAARATLKDLETDKMLDSEDAILALEDLVFGAFVGRKGYTEELVKIKNEFGINFNQNVNFYSEGKIEDEGGSLKGGCKILDQLLMNLADADAEIPLKQFSDSTISVLKEVGATNFDCEVSTDGKKISYEEHLDNELKDLKPTEKDKEDPEYYKGRMAIYNAVVGIKTYVHNHTPKLESELSRKQDYSNEAGTIFLNHMGVRIKAVYSKSEVCRNPDFFINTTAQFHGAKVSKGKIATSYRGGGIQYASDSKTDCVFDLIIVDDSGFKKLPDNETLYAYLNSIDWFGQPSKGGAVPGGKR